MLAVLCVILNLPVTFSLQKSTTGDPRCGVDSLYVALLALGKAPSRLEEVESLLGPSPEDGYSLSQLNTAARSLGLQTILVETSLDNLAERR